MVFGDVGWNGEGKRRGEKKKGVDMEGKKMPDQPVILDIQQHNNSCTRDKCINNS